MARIGIIGCGNMGMAVAKAVPRPRSMAYCYDTDKEKAKELSKKYKIKTAAGNVEVAKRCKVIILAVKPQNMEAVLKEIRGSLDSSKLLVSIAAGIKTAAIEKGLQGKVAVLRVMPNMPALIGAGIFAICKGRFACRKDLLSVKRLFSCIGEVVEVKEGLMDAVTAISGSGPAYFFYLVEVLIRAAKGLGLKGQIAERLVIGTALGSARVLKETGQAPELLRAKVSSKGGTTEAAFKEFYKHDLEAVLRKGIKRAAKRAKELSRDK